ncbi:hypothetical protein LSTR_LSTR016555 [Laodelphax striatellus]|uniref:Uncharacterized protein n=1 Tax=Laodelphax striatellus TaxID=195883 RepID=A0A482XKJ1_LAOST|nr:hypothetical protein LSTR_LSTR016555 [Laodelphax striatellus]
MRGSLRNCGHTANASPACRYRRRMPSCGHRLTQPAVYFRVFYGKRETHPRHWTALSREALVGECQGVGDENGGSYPRGAKNAEKSIAGSDDAVLPAR